MSQTKPTIEELEALLEKPHRGYVILPDGQIRSCQDEPVNALAGLNPEAVREVIEAARRMDKYQPPQEGDCLNSDSNILRRALARLDSTAAEGK